MVLDVRTLRAAIRVAGDFVASGSSDMLTDDNVRFAMDREDANAEVHEVVHLAEALIAFAKVIQKQPTA